MKTITSVADFLHWRKNQSTSIGFIPTLGALHGGHLSLIRASKRQCDLTVVSIFLNPTQFAPDEDLSSYPKTLNRDIKHLKNHGVDILFLPTENEMYKRTDDVSVPATTLFNKLEGLSRPRFFYGVTTIVAKLFNIIQPTHAFFGEKDAQQLYIIQQMITQMNYPIALVSCPIIRDKNGLALSSRNQYLTLKERRKASMVYKALMHIKDALDRGQKNPVILKQTFEIQLHQIPEITIDYISIACTKTLNEVAEIRDIKLLISTALFFKGVRLIDNFTYSPSTT